MAVLILITLLIGSAGLCTAANPTYVIPIGTYTPVVSINPAIIFSLTTKVNIDSSSFNINLDSPATITVTAKYYNDTPIVGATIKLKSSGGTLGSTTGTTNSQGKFTTTFKSSTSGVFNLNATASKSGYYDSTTNVNITVKNNPPSAYFSLSPSSGQTPLEVTFDASGSTDIGGTITTYSWNFGDGKTGTGKTVKHTYNTSGTYYPSLTVTDNLGLSNSTSGQILVGATNQPPVATFSASAVSGSSPLTVTFDASDSVDNDGTITSYAWSFSDGGSATGKVVSHTFDGEGNYTAILTVTDNMGVYSTNETLIAVEGSGGAPGLGTAAILIGALIILAILAVAIFVLLKMFQSNLQVIPKQKEAPCDGKSTIPLKVLFVNGFGKPKKQSSDVEVEFEATAGSIKNVIIPSGRELVEAVLTTSKECGPVDITAKANGKIAKAQVKFIYGKATIEMSASPDSIPADGKSSANITIKFKDGEGSYFSWIEEKNVDIKTTLGTIPGTVKISPKTPEVTTSVTSGEVSGTAIITAASGDIKGETKVVFKGLPKRFCMHCGAPMELEAPSCHKCGLTPPSGVDVKVCPTCETVLPEAAKFCYSCGARQPNMES
ncbi:PKD domain-containing protein [Methanooceanicella nereidis]|uniref:PKD domain-containing protein n=1 Tax=Methanooceanicella nereidis TaxID=2052831 RepID=UPI001E28FA73|nr:PKD domain-containing protein [Methanocella sp. CWC-04]